MPDAPEERLSARISARQQTSSRFIQLDKSEFVAVMDVCPFPDLFGNHNLASTVDREHGFDLACCRFTTGFIRPGGSVFCHTGHGVSSVYFFPRSVRL